MATKLFRRPRADPADPLSHAVEVDLPAGRPVSGGEPVP